MLRPGTPLVQFPNRSVEPRRQDKSAGNDGPAWYGAAMTRFAILLDGELTVTAAVRRRIAGCRVIAADGAIRHARALDVVPELWVGDFDSSDPRDEARFAEVPRRTFPRRKDRTDGELAVALAIERGADAFVFLGALGGQRSDHAMQHLLQAVGMKERGLEVVLTSGTETAWPLIAGTGRFELEPGTVFSVLCLSECRGLSIRGAQWPLEGTDVPFGSSLTVSNVATGPVELSLSAGRAALLAQTAAPAGA